MNADIMIERIPILQKDRKMGTQNVEPVQCRTMRTEAELKCDRFAQQRAAWECLKFFEITPVYEADFRKRFVEMPTDDVTLLKAFYNVKTDAELLAVICRFWNVRI
ncbi:MAG: hypothetical protein ACYSUX_14770 [Planctomycetota bacterium]|jgi:hypothetical protein